MEIENNQTINQLKIIEVEMYKTKDPINFQLLYSDLKNKIFSVNFTELEKHTVNYIIDLINKHVVDFINAIITIEKLENNISPLLIQIYGAIYVSQRDNKTK